MKKTKKGIRKTVRNLLILLLVLAFSSIVVYMVKDTYAYNETIPEKYVLSSAKKSKARKVSPEEYQKKIDDENQVIEEAIKQLNNRSGSIKDSDRVPSKAVPGKYESELLFDSDNGKDRNTRSSSIIEGIATKTQDVLLNYGLVSTASGHSDGIITGDITFGKDGKYIKLKDSGAKTYKQSGSTWGDKKYGKRLNKDNKNICSKYSEAGCAPAALSNALGKYISATPLTIGNYIRDKYPDYRNNYTSSNPCNSGTSSKSIKNVPGNFVASDQHILGSKSVSWDDAKAAVNNNIPVIFKTTNSNFTSGAHYLVIRGKIKRKSDDKVFYWLSDSSSKNIKGATGAVIIDGDAGFWKIYKTDLVSA